MPNNWAITSFEEIVELISGRDLETSSCNDIKEGIPYLIGASNIVKRSLFITRWTTKPIVISQKNDILISCKGTIGEVIRNTIGDIHIARQFMALRNNSIVDTNYIELYIRAILERIKSDARGVIPGISREDILCREFLLPPLNEQKRIVLEASKLISIIEKINVDKNELVKAIAAYKLTILQLAITGKLVPQDLSDEPAIDLLRRVNPNYKPCDNRHYENVRYPGSWKVIKMGELVRIISGVAYSKSDVTVSGIKVIRGGNIQAGEIIECDDDVYIDSRYAAPTNNIHKGDIVLVASTGSQQLIGKTGFARRDYVQTQIGAFLRILRPKDIQCADFLNLVFQSDYYRQYIRSLAKGTNINNVKNSYIEDFVIGLPPLQEQNRIVAITNKIFHMMDEILADL